MISFAWGDFIYGDAQDFTARGFFDPSPVADAGQNQLTWRGVGIGRVRQSPTPEQTTREVDEAVAEILKDFPPGRG